MNDGYVNTYLAKLFFFKFQPLEVVSRYRDSQPEVVSRYRDSQPQVAENYSYLFNLRPNIYKS